MRISDWSSDVCSSDLGYTTHSAVGTRKFSTVGSMVDSELLSQIKISATPVGSNVIGGLVSRYTDDSNSYHCWLVFTTTDGLHLTIAKRGIGKAACWERGCEYV